MTTSLKNKILSLLTGANDDTWMQEIEALINGCDSEYELEEALDKVPELLPSNDLMNWVLGLLKKRLTALRAQKAAEADAVIVKRQPPAPTPTDDTPSPF